MTDFRMNSPEGKAILALARGGDYAHPGEEEAIVLASKLIDRSKLAPPDQKVPRILDVGCGRGGTAAWFHRQGWGQVVGIDIDAASIDYARATYPQVKFHRQDVSRLSWTEFGNFDLIYLLTAYYAFPDQREALFRLRSVCKDGGTLLIVDYTRPSNKPPPDQLGEEIGKPIVLERLTNALGDSGWGNIVVDDWTPRFVGWYDALLLRFEEHQRAITDGYGPDWYEYVVGWYGKLRAALAAGQLGGAAVRATAPDPGRAAAGSGEIDSELVRLHRRFQELRQVMDILSDQKALLSDDYEEAFRLLVASEIRYLRLPRHQVLPRLRQLTNKWADIGKEYSETQLFGIVQGEMERAGRRLVGNSPTQPVIFISYRRKEQTQEMMGWIAGGLRRRFGHEAVFFDTSSIRYGLEYESIIDGALASCSIFLICIDDAWSITDTGVDWVYRELKNALDWDRVIIPLLLKGTEIPKESDLPEAVRRPTKRQGMQLSPDKSFERNPGLLADLIVDNIVDLIGAGRFPPGSADGPEPRGHEAGQNAGQAGSGTLTATA